MAKDITDSNSKMPAVILFLFFTCLFLYIPIAVLEELNIFSLIDLRYTVIKEKSLIPALIFGLPTIAAIMYLLLLQILSKATPKTTKSGIKFIIFSFPLLLLAVFIYPWQVSRYIENQGYSVCQYYSGATLGAPTIWVKSPSYCIDDGYQVRIELVDWLVQFDGKIKQVTPPEVKNKILELKK